MTDDERRAMRRQILLEVIGNNRNTWMDAYGWASYHISYAVAAGKIQPYEIQNFVPYHTEDCIAIAQRAGIFPGELAGISYHADDEDVTLAVEAIRGLVEVPFAPDTNPWHFHYELPMIEEVPTSFVELEQARKENITDYAVAAAFIKEADDEFVKRVRARA